MTLAQDLQSQMNQMAAAYGAGDAAAVAALFTQDAQLHSSFASPAIGRTAIETLHVDWTADRSEKSFTLLDSGGNEDVAWGLFRFAEGQVTGAGTSLAVFERQSNGAWLVRSCCLFGDDAA